MYYYVTLGSEKHAFLIKSDTRHFFVRSGHTSKLRSNYVVSWFVNLLYLFLRHNYVTYLFDVVTFFDDVRITLYFGTFELCTLENGHFLVTFVWNQKLTKKDT